MYQLNRDGRRIEHIGVDAKALARGIYQQGPHAFAAAENGVAHRLVEAGGSGRCMWKGIVQSCIHARRIGRNSICESVRQWHATL